MTNIDTRLWALFADSCGSTVESLRSECIAVSVTSVGYMEMRLRSARVLPWSLLGPDKEEKLESLKRDDKPSDIVSGKIWELVRMEVFDVVCLAGLRLLEDAPWATAAVEEWHASTAMLVRQHFYDD